MEMLKKFYPDFIYRSVQDFEEDFFKKNNIKYVVLDIDNTLVPYTVKTPTKPAIDFLRRLEGEGIRYCFLSNNNVRRVMLFNENINADFQANAKKPFIGGLNRILNRISAEKDKTLIIGDQIFTDVWTGKRAGIRSVLVDPIEDKETLFFKFKRALERIVLKSYHKNR